ncbi:transposase [Acidithiobacillus ferrianus]|uniref:transposase n=1 Tax=Acidithiobacillus ferrianus TaxID=2678518 RepID=UPI0034E3833C
MAADLHQALNAQGHSVYARFTTIKGFTSTAIEGWARSTLDTECQVLTDGLHCFNGIAGAGRSHAVILACGRKPRDLLQFGWVNAVLGNLKTGLSGAYHAFKFRKYAQRYLSTMTYRFNHRFNLATLPMSLLRAAVNTEPRPARWLRAAESSC